MAEVLTLARRRELRQLAATVSSVEDAHRIIKAQDLHADPGDNTSIFYYGQGVDGAKALSTREGFVRLEQTERGYFLDQVTRNLAEDGVIPRGSDENKALFGEHDQKRLGEWGEASKEFAENTRGSPVVFPDPNRGPDQFKQTVFYNAELPALSGNQAIRGLSPMSYTCDEAGVDQDFGFARAFAPISPAFANDGAFGLNESQLVLVRVGGETAADVLHSLGGDFGAVQLPSQAPAWASASQSQGVVTTKTIPPRVPSTTQDRTPQVSRGGLKR